MQPALRSPPAFEVSAGGDFIWRALCAMLCALAVAALLAWLASHHVSPSGWGVAGVLLVLPGAWLGWRLAASRPCRLRWDGQGWQLSEPGPVDMPLAVKIAVLMDLGFWLMLRLVPLERGSAAQRTLRLGRSGVGAANWHLLRATLYSARGQQAMPARQADQP
jgi:hypothetical protein